MATPAFAAGGDLSFSVWRLGSRIGEHNVRFTRDGEELTVESSADFAIGLGPIALYRYKYRATEGWRQNRLETLSARTDDNGAVAFVDAALEGDSIMVTGSKSGRYAAPPGAIAATHWNAAELSQPMINPQNGELMRFDCRDLGWERLESGSPARHFALSGYAVLDLWYDESDVWRALRAVARDGSLIDYRPL